MNKQIRRQGWGFEIRNIDQSLRPQDDFYQFANGMWLKKNTIPPEETTWGSFSILRFQTERQLKKILLELVKVKSVHVGSPKQLVRDMYLSALNMNLRNTLAITPIVHWRSDIQKISSQKELLAYIAHAHCYGGAAPWIYAIDQDIKNSNKYLLTLWQGGLSMPEREYYLSGSHECRRVRKAYGIHIKRLLFLAGFSSKEISIATRVIMEIETALAKASMSKEEIRNVEKTYHKLSLTKLSHDISHINWKYYFKMIGANSIKEVNLAQPKFFIEMSILLTSLPLEKWKIYLQWHLINESAPLLSDKFVRENFHFYGTVFTGTKKMKPLWRLALETVNGSVGEALGKLYVDHYFTAHAKKIMDTLVRDLFKVYEERILKLEWMRPQTKRHAITKLRAMNRKIGYPAQFETYSGLVIKQKDFFGNVLRVSKFKHHKAMRRLRKPVDRKKWFMTPQTVNAYNHMNLNEIVFPAAILQAPFFNLYADDAINYAAIGSVIGHEMTHGFDDQGSKFNHKGNLKSWWTSKDKKYFTQKGKLLEQQFNTYEILPGIRVNGKLTLGENIADLGGLAIAFDAYQKHLKKIGRKYIAGFTPEERFFFGYAQCERQLSRSEFRKTLILVDPHSPASTRINGSLSNFSPFYSTFKLTKKDKLYREPNKRVVIW